MPRIDLNLSAVAKERLSLQSLQSEQRRVERDLAEKQAALDAAERAGESPNVTGMLREAVVQAGLTRQRVAEKRRNLSAEIDGLANGLLRERDPAQMVESMDGGQPIALLPMRLETRYFPPGQPNSLRVRVYPDDLNTIEHTNALTSDELQRGMDHWQARFRSDEDDAARISRDLALVFGRGRAAWVIRATTPDNLDELGQIDAAPRFPDVATISAKAKETRAVLLPDRWCAIGYAAGRREVFRVWGNRIPDELLLSPDWLNTGTPEPLLGGERAWLVDFDAAMGKGMALTITQQAVNDHARQHHARAFDLATGTLERLVVVGLEWTKDPATSAQELADLLAAQRDSHGLGFVPLGTPTNNTEAAPAGHSPSQERAAPATDAENALLPAQKDALQLLTSALGLPPDSLPADNIANAHLAEQRTALHMMNALWRGTFGHYLTELWNSPGEEKDRILKTPTLYALRRYAVQYLRPAGPLPLLRVNRQPYGLLPVTGRRFESPPERTSDTATETAIAGVIGVLRPMWEAVLAKVPLLKDGNVEKAQAILQTSPWSQAAYYRDRRADPVTVVQAVDPEVPGTKGFLIQKILAPLGVKNHRSVNLYRYENFLPQDAYPAEYLAAVPWVLMDATAPQHEAPDDATLPPDNNYIATVAAALRKSPAAGDLDLNAQQDGPALLQMLLAYSAQMERHDAVEATAKLGTAIYKGAAYATTKMAYVEAARETEATFIVSSPKELASVSIPAITGKATLGEHVVQQLNLQPVALANGEASKATSALFDAVKTYTTPTRDVGAVALSLDYLSKQTVGDLNHAFRTTLDAFSYRLDAWYTARASRRLEQLRAQKPTGIHVGGFAWVENLKADHRPDSDGHLLAPSLGQASSAAILRSGFMANHEQGAFNINLDSQRTARAQSILEGLRRDQPLAALYGYRVERGLRDAALGKFIWPLRLSYPWRAASGEPRDEPQEAIGARDVVDAVALFEAWEPDAGATVRARLAQTMTDRPGTGAPPTLGEFAAIAKVVADGLDLADSVSDLLMAEGMHQIMQGNFERAGAAMAVADKQSLPIETQVSRTPRGGASYTQRVALLCPAPDEAWPRDRRSRTEPSLNAWLAHMLGEPARYSFSAQVHRLVIDEANPQGLAVVDAQPITVPLASLGLSPIAMVLMATSSSASNMTGPVANGADTGFRARLVKAFADQVANPGNVTGLDVSQEGVDASMLGLGHFEALATTLRALLDKTRVLTRKDVVTPDDKIEATLPAEGEYPGVDRAELQARAAALVADFSALTTLLDASANADELLANLGGMDDFLPRQAWPQQVLAIDAANADPATRDERAMEARRALKGLTDSKLEAVNEPIELLADQLVPTHGQLVKQAMDQIRLLLGKDFPVLPRFAIGAYATEFNASLAEQDALTQKKPWCVSGWVPKLARVRDGLDRFAATLSAHEALVGMTADDFRLVQFPHRSGQIWAASPEAWREPEGTPLDTTKVPEELHDYLKKQPGAPYKNINRIAPDMALVLHAPGGLDALAQDTLMAGLVCDEWPEFVPDPFQTAAIAFHYDAPGARPPQSIVLALPPRLGQDNWHFDEVLDVIHEAWDLARLRGVKPLDLEGSLGLVLPGNYLPQNYTDVLPSVQMLKLQRDARKRLMSTALKKGAAFTLGKV
jgi:hypothetical protein